MKKLNPIEALAKIRALVSRFFEAIGREIFDNIEEAREDLIQKIDEVLRRTQIPQKYIVIEKLQLDKEDN